MKYLMLSLVITFIGFNVTAQTSNIEAIKDEENTYPVNNPQPLNNKTTAFLALFNKDVNLGNLHLYSFLDKPSENYYFSGQTISLGMSDMFSPDLRATKNRKNAAYFAVQAIRGNGQENYIIRSPGKSGNNRLALYQLNGNKLQLLTELANAVQKGSEVEQTDAWIRDVNGDTLLDVILVEVKKREGKKLNSKIVSVLLMQEDGTFMEENIETFDPLILLTEDL